MIRSALSIKRLLSLNSHLFSRRPYRTVNITRRSQLFCIPSLQFVSRNATYSDEPSLSDMEKNIKYFKSLLKKVNERDREYSAQNKDSHGGENRSEKLESEKLASDSTGIDSEYFGNLCRNVKRNTDKSNRTDNINCIPINESNVSADENKPTSKETSKNDTSSTTKTAKEVFDEIDIAENISPREKFFDEFSEFDKLRIVSSSEIVKQDFNEVDVPELKTSLGQIAKQSLCEIESFEKISTSEIAPQSFHEMEKPEGVPSLEIRRKTAPPVKSYNLASFVTRSESLQELVKLGVDLSVIERAEGAANAIVRLDFTSDIQPVLLFLKDVGIHNDDIGIVITKNPKILTEKMENLRLTLKYLESKNFDSDMVARVLTKAPSVFTMPVVKLDSILGKYQRIFKLTGQELREAVSRLPKLINRDTQEVRFLRDHMINFLGFKKSETKEILLVCPRVYLGSRYTVHPCFHFLHDVMGISHRQMVEWPGVFRTRLHRIKERHAYLEQLGRAQYDPKVENYVSLKALVSGRDRDFCFEVAKTSVARYDEFLKCR